MWFSFIFLFPSKGNFHVWKVFCNGQSHKDAFRNILHNGVLLLMTFPKIYKNRGTEYSVQNYTFREPKSPVWRTQPFTVAIRSLLQPNLFGGSGLCAHRRVPRAALECGCWAPGSRLPFDLECGRELTPQWLRCSNATAFVIPGTERPEEGPACRAPQVRAASGPPHQERLGGSLQS